MSKERTLGELRTSGYAAQSVKDEMRANLLAKLRSNEKLFPGILGYEETVIPQLVNAILARHNLILLGLRGQAKSRILRQLTELLDEEIPIIAGSEVNDNPFAPLSAYGRQQIELHAEETKIDWVNRDNRFVEKLATPDVTIADIIGDVDPIKAAKGGHLLSDELTIHFGLLPRAKPGWLCHHLAIEDNLRRGMVVYDLLAGHSQFKASFAAATGTLAWVTVERNGWKPWLMSRLRRAKQLLRAGPGAKAD